MRVRVAGFQFDGAPEKPLGGSGIALAPGVMVSEDYEAGDIGGIRFQDIQEQVFLAPSVSPISTRTMARSRRASFRDGSISRIRR